MNAVSQARLAELHPELQRRWRQVDDAMSQLGIPVLITEAFRPWDRQADLYAMGRTKPSTVLCSHGGVQRAIGACGEHPRGATVTNARPGYSFHQFALALDVVPETVLAGGKLEPDWNVTHPEWRKLLAVGKTFGLAEGAEWRTYPDYPHMYLVELPATPTNEVRDLYAAGGMQTVWAWADQRLNLQTSTMGAASGR